MIRLGPVL